MSRLHREQDAWPATEYARFLWLAYGVWDDIHALSELYKSNDVEYQRLVVARHILVDFDALDELLREFHVHVKSCELSKLNNEDSQIMETAFGEYHRSVQPYRETIKEIRNNLGAHRTGAPWEKSSRKEDFSPDEWGKWETYLVELEKRCDLVDWVDTLNSAHHLLVTLDEFNLSGWFNMPDKGGIRFSLPILSPGYYPKKRNSL